MSIASEAVAPGSSTRGTGSANALGLPFAQVMRLAVRELRSGIGGFYIFIACVALGVMAIAGVSALSDSLKNGLVAQGAQLLGGDITFSRMHTPATADQRAAFDARGRVSETATLRTMARLPNADDQTLAALKSVDDAYPLIGDMKLASGRDLGALIRTEQPTAVVDPILLERLGLKIGDTMRIGSADVQVVDTIEKEPDGLSDRQSFGPRVLVSRATLNATDLVKPGSLVQWRYAVALDDASLADLPRARDDLQKGLADAGYTVTDRRDPSPQIRRTLERLRQFLTLIGLTALLVGGVGVANAVATYIDRRRKTIATYKSLGATNAAVFAIFLTQVLLMAAIGVAIGLAGGVTVPAILDALYADALPVEARFTISPWSIFSAAAYGLLVALLFTLWPLGRTEAISPAVLFRDQVGEKAPWPRPLIIGATAAVALTLAGFAVATSDSRQIALAFCVGLLILFAVFALLGWLVQLGARRMPRPKRPEVALAIGNLGAPGGLTQSVILSLGAGLSLLVAVALANASIVSELAGRLPANSPDFFLLDVEKSNFDALKAAVRVEQPKAVLESAPMLRGRLVELKGTPVEKINAPPEAEWVLNGSRGLTYAADIPTGSKVVQGAWWAADYSGPPLVSFEADLAKKLNVDVGDSVTINVLGRNITAEIANLRELNWENLTINFVMVFSPNTLSAAPHNLLATVRLPESATLKDEANISRSLARNFPAVTAIRVKDAINAFNEIFAKVMTAVQAAGGVTLLAGALVLAGALATAQRRRIQEAVILKALGATRRQILTAHFVEYVLLAAATTGVAILLGAGAAWFALTQIMEVAFVLSWAAIGQALAVALGLVLAFGGYGTWRVLNAPPVPYLRSG